MATYQRSIGVRPLLFERLVEYDGLPSDMSHSGPSRMHDESALRASVARELSDLLNTRVPLPIDVLEQRARSAIDYGIPDLSAFPRGQHEAMVRLAHHIRSAILAYEPRLHAPAVEIGHTGPNPEILTVIVRGTLHMGMMRVPVTFELPLGTGADVDDAA